MVTKVDCCLLPQEVYRKIIPLYFPRNSSEEEQAFDHLPSDIGNEEGEPIIKERQIRIIDKPGFAGLSEYCRICCQFLCSAFMVFI